MSYFKIKLVHSFSETFHLISRFFFVKFGLGKVFGDFLERKLAVLDHENTDLKKSEILHFSKGVSPWF